MRVKRNKRKRPDPGSLLKFEIATDLGLSEKVAKEGWGGLTAQETGRIGGRMSGKVRRKGGDKEE